MKIVLLVEGETEKRALPPFFQRWLKGQIDPVPAIAAVNTKGCDNHIKECALKASIHLRNADVLAVIGLLDLHGPEYPDHCTTTQKKCDYLRERLEKEVRSPKFKQHFAIHELEAWLLSDPSIFPTEVGRALPRKAAQPETINSTEPPSKLLTRLYRDKTKRDYKKTTNGSELFSKLDPAVAASKCKALAVLLDDLLEFAKTAPA